MALLRREAERSDFGVSSFLLLQSLAGGTGSGVGARVSELLRDEFGNRSVIANALVAPYSAGEVSVQLYNSLLTLTHTAQSSDAVLLFQNDQIQSICQTRMRLTTPSFHDLNKVIAKHLSSSLLLPSNAWGGRRGGGGGGGGGGGERGLEDAVRHLCSHPSYRMLGIKMIPFGAEGDQRFDTSTWKGMLRRLHQMQMDPEAYMEDCIDWSLSSGTTVARGGGGGGGGGSGGGDGGEDSSVRLGSKGVNRTLAATLVLRGRDAQSTLDSAPQEENNHRRPSKHDHNQDQSTTQNQEHFRYPPSHWVETPGMFLTHLNSSFDASFDASFSSVLDIRTDGHAFDQWERSASIVSNSQTVVTPFRRVLTNATEMFQANAYVHQYESHGFEKEDINEAFEQMTQIVHDYSLL
jgi:tubulin delta